MRWGDFKPRLAEAMVEHLRPMQERYAELRKDEATLDGVLADGADKARAVADGTLGRLKDAMGFDLPRS